MGLETNVLFFLKTNGAYFVAKMISQKILAQLMYLHLVQVQHVDSKIYLECEINLGLT